MPISIAAHFCLILAIGYVVAALRSARGWRSVSRRAGVSSFPALSVVVPARNEARSIERSVRALLAQRHISDLEVIVVDDQSSDATADIVRRVAADDRRVTLVHGAPLPSGWIGKSWALYQGARVARAAWLLFVDADTVVGPDTAATTLEFAIDNGAGAVSIIPQMETVTFWERAIIPLVFSTFPIVYGSLDDFNDPRRRDRAFLYGPYILIAKAAYDAVGGHEAVRAEMCEDMELALLLKRDQRFRPLVVEGRALATFRHYHSFRELWVGFTKNTVTGARGSVRTILLGSSLMLALSVVPLLIAGLAIAGGQIIAGAEGLLSTGIVLAATARSFSKLGVPGRFALYQPLGFAVMAVIGLASLIRVESGRGVEWRGRRYTGKYKGTLP